MSKRKKAVIAVIIIAVIGVIVYFGVTAALNTETTDGYNKNAVSAEFGSPSIETIVTKISAEGRSELVEKNTVYASYGGKVETMDIREGDIVNEGDVLFTYSRDSLTRLYDELNDAQISLESARIQKEGVVIPVTKAEIEQAEMAVRQAEQAIEDVNFEIAAVDDSIALLERDLQTAREELQTNKKLLDAGLMTRVEYEQYETAITAIEDNIAKTWTQRQRLADSLPLKNESLAYAESQYQYTLTKNDNSATANLLEQQEVMIKQASRMIERINREISKFVGQETSKFSGTVLSVNCGEGSIVQEGAPLFVISDLSEKNLVIKIDVPEKEARTVKIGQEAELRFYESKEVFTGVVSKIAPFAEDKQIGQTVEPAVTVEIAVTKNMPGLKAGYTVQTEIITNTARDVICIPIMSAMLDTDGSNYVYVVNSDYMVEKRTVELGAYSGMVVEAKGVSIEERVIVNPSQRIEEGVYVKPLGVSAYAEQ